MSCCTTNYKTISGLLCPSLMAVEKFEIWFPLLKSDGTKFKIALADITSKATWTALINAANAQDRCYILPFMDNIVDERADPTFETLDSGKQIKTRQGDRDFTGFFIQEQNCILSELEEWEKAGAWGKMVVDKDGNIIYKICASDPGYAYPIQVDDASLNVDLVKPTYSTSMKHRVQYRYAQIERDGDIRLTPASDLDFDPLTDGDFKGLINVEGTVSGISTTQFTIALADCSGCPITGLLAGDMTLTDRADDSAIVISTVTESPDGTYVVEYPAETPGVNMKLVITKAGLNTDDVANIVITIP